MNYPRLRDEITPTDHLKDRRVLVNEKIVAQNLSHLKAETLPNRLASLSSFSDFVSSAGGPLFSFGAPALSFER